ncbi:MAG TPA: heavy metal sensor histidine kinase [Steroidobacteraceae bacterium]
MRRWSFTARLTMLFALILIACFIAVGVILVDALTDEIYAENDLSIVLACRHLRRLATEMRDVSEVREHQARLISLVLGDAAQALEVQTAAGEKLIEYNPPHVTLPTLPATEPDQRIVVEHLSRWESDLQLPVRGIASFAQLRDGTRIRILVARSMQDRAAMLQSYQRLIWLTELLTLVAAVAASYVAIRRAVRPLRTIAASALTVNTERLDSRIEVGGAPPEVQQLAGSLNQMLQRLEQGFRRLWEFTADLAHDLRTPIGNIRGSSEVTLSRARSATEYQATLASTIEECDRLSVMIENVLFLARADSPQFAWRPLTLNVGDELRHIAEYFEGLAEDAGVAIAVHGDAQISAERDLFRRAVSNLLANALRYTAKGGVIALTVDDSAAGTTVTVRNPGPEISSADLPRLFDRFYRGDPARSGAGASSGLGLAIVKTIMDLHGGTAHATSGAGHTEFQLTFPKIRQTDLG